MRVPWTPLSPSRRERVVRRWAAVLGAAAAGLLLAAALRAQPADPTRLALALLTAAGAAAAARRRSCPAVEVGVDPDGRLVARREAGPGSVEQGLQCVFAAPWLITLRCGTICFPIWPDAVPENTFRRLWVHVRWSSARHPVGFPSGTSPGQPK